MAKGRSVFHLLALKQKVALAKKNRTMKTLQDELARTKGIRDQLSEMVGTMNVPVGETTIRHLRSASWYGNQVQEQLGAISNRAEFLSEEVDTHRKDIAITRHKQERAVEKSIEHERAEQLEREERAAALMPPRR
jgi:hypothetical protein